MCWDRIHRQFGCALRRNWLGKLIDPEGRDWLTMSVEKELMGCLSDDGLGGVDGVDGLDSTRGR